MENTDYLNSANTQTCTYSYDDLARLASTSCLNGATKVWGQNFSYDAFGNITKTVPNGYTGVSFQPTYGSGNHISSAPVQYDNNGRMITDNLSYQYAYDVEGRPVSVNGTQITYDASGLAVEITNGSGSTQMVYLPTGRKFAYMNGQTVQKYIVPLAGGVQEVYDASGLQYIRQSDWLGSSRVQMNANNSFRGSLAYAPFGETYAESAPVDRSFTGQTQDVIAGTQGDYDFLFRQLSASQGRWLVPDPAGLAAVDITNPQTWNRYAYVANNPLSNVDPLGLYIRDCSTKPCTGLASFWDFWGNTWGNGWNRFEYQIEPPDREAFRETQPPDDPNRPPLRNHNRCGAALKVAGQTMGAVQNAFANWSALDSAAKGNWDGASLLAAVGVRESGFQNVNENDGENSARLGKRHRSSPRPGAIGLYYFCHAKICFQSFFMLITVQPLALASSYRD